MKEAILFSNERIRGNRLNEQGQMEKKLSIKINSTISHDDQMKLFQRYNFDLLRNENNNSSNKRSLFINEFQRCRINDAIWNFLDRLPPLSPYNKIVISWDIVQILALFILLFSYPLIYSINATFNKTIESIFSVIVLSDIIIRLNIGFFEMDTFIVSKKKICLRYLSNGFVYDFLGNISIISYFVSNTDYHYPWILLILAKSQIIRKLLINVEEIFFHNYHIRNWLKLLKLIFTIAFFSHLFACCWLLIGRQDKPLTWMVKANILKEDWQYIYARSLYFSLVTMITVGYGDITPTNFGETIFVTCVMMLACGIFGYSLNQIGQIFDGAFRSQDRLRENIAIMSIYMKKKKISTPLQFKIRQYLQFYWNENKAEEQEKEQEIRSILSQQLQDELILDANKLVLREARILVDNFSESVMKKTASLIKQLNCTPEEVIFQEGDINDQNLYFIEQGQCEIYLDGIERKQGLQDLTQGQYFGSWSFFTGFSRSCSIRSKGFCTLLFINRQEFIEICKQNIEEFEKFCFIRDKMIFDSDYERIENKCFCCHQYSHQLYDCSILHYNDRKNVQEKLKDDASFQSKFRMQFKTLKKGKKLKAISIISKISHFQKLFLQQNQIDIQKYENDNFLTIIASMYHTGNYEIDESFNNNDDSPLLLDDSPMKNQAQFQSQSSKKWSAVGGVGGGQDLFQGFPRANSQLTRQNTNPLISQQELTKQSSNIAHSIHDEQLASIQINANTYPAVEQNYFFSQQIYSQNTDGSKKLSISSSPPKFPKEDDVYIIQKVPMIPLSTVEQTDNQKSGNISTILAINSNINPTATGYPSRNFKSNQTDLTESGGKFDKQRSNQTVTNQNKIEMRSRNNSQIASCSNLSCLNIKSQQFCNKISNNLIELDNEHEELRMKLNQQDDRNAFEQSIVKDEYVNSLSQIDLHPLQLQKSLSIISSSLQKLHPFRKQNSMMRQSSNVSKTTNMLSALLKFKKLSKKVKNKFQIAEKELQQQSSQQNASQSRFNSNGIEMSPQESKNNQKINLDLNEHSEDMFFFLMKHRNIYQYSHSQQILDESFERMRSFTFYYPLGNSDIIIKMLSLSLEDKNKHFRRILELQRNDFQRSKRHLNSISRLKEKFQNEQNTVDNTPNKQNEESKTANNEFIVNQEFESFSTINAKQKLTPPQIKQQFSHFVQENQSQNYIPSPIDGVTQLENIDNNNNVNLVGNYTYFQDNSQLSALMTPPPQLFQQLPSSSLTQKQSKFGIKSKYYIPKQQEEHEEEIQDMERDLHSTHTFKDINNTINVSIPNNSINNQLIKDYLNEM